LPVNETVDIVGLINAPASLREKDFVMTLDAAVRERLESIPTATFSAVLQKQGVRSAWMQGPRHRLGAGRRIAGPAFTLRFIPVREDLAALAATPTHTTRAAIEAMPQGCVAVADTQGRVHAGMAGDILCARMQKRGIRALVTDGAIRDAGGIAPLAFDVWSASTAAPLPGAALHFVGWQEPIGCGGVAVMPGDIVVADDDGVVVVPAALLDTVLSQSIEQEREEAWVMQQVQRGEPLVGLYPMSADTRRRYEAAHDS
jgi:regulator of RNase E activity RraA